MMLIRRSNTMAFTRETFVRKFFKMNKLPFPVAREEYLEYYSTIAGYEDIVTKFNGYINYIESVGYETAIKLEDELIKQLHLDISNNPNYKVMRDGRPKNTSLHYQPKYKSIYTDELLNRRILSIDMKSANFTQLRLNGVIEEDTYTDFISKYTDNEELINSKFIRQVLFGKLNSNMIMSYTKAMMNEGLMQLGDLLTSEQFLSLVSDEALFDITDYELTEDKLTAIMECFPNCRYEIFTITKCKYGYVRNFEDGRIDFKSIPKDYWLENYKDYHDLKLEYNDLLFLGNDRTLSLRMEDKDGNDLMKFI